MTTHLVTPEEFDGEELEITGDPYRHLFRALRLSTGAQLRVVDGEGRARSATVESVEKSRASLRLGDSEDSLEPLLRVDLLVATPKPERASWLVEKCTELGVASVVFFGSSRSAREFSQNRLDRLGRIARSALEQCGRSCLPKVLGTLSWQEVLDQIEEVQLVPGAQAEFFHPDVEATQRQVSGKVPWGEAGQEVTAEVTGSGRKCLLVIGPEGGFSDEEVESLKGAGAAGRSLGPLILRIETAAVVAVARKLCIDSGLSRS